MAIVTAKEMVCLGPDMVGHLSLKQDVLLQGLIMASQSQIDAGYEGRIFALLYNLSDNEVTLEYGDSVLRLELVRLAERTEKPYEGDFQGITLAKALQRPVGSSLEGLRHEVDRIRKLLLGIPVATLLAIVIAIVLASVTGFIGWASNLNERIVRLEEKAAQRDSSAAGRIGAVNRDIAKLRCEIRRQGSAGEQDRSFPC
ncbi:MAG TPA: hypothetical protein VHF90_00590 [Thermoleophilaceae bacterium]|nr:hypothetical protein [Thermoleophilaceae bacterium]